ncbi:MAG: class I SAM-dependent methyltransferase [Chloroflexi bacterium]|nr:class I SAM-dependent methyltransferase [Chloroflexota bacterium]
MPQKEKESVRQFWDAVPCGTGDVSIKPGTLEYFEAISERRNKLEPFIADYARFEKWVGKRVLEVGCGAGSDLLRFARAGARVAGMDLSPRSAALAKSRLCLYNCQGGVLIADAEQLPFKNRSFDLVYSWGVLHHTPDTEQAIKEIYRVTSPGGEICIMLYHRHSLVSLQMYLRYGLFVFKPLRSLKDILASHHESPGTKAYTVTEARQMFSAFRDVKIKVCLTPYDLRYRRDGYLPSWVGNFIPKRLGWFIIIMGRKSSQEVKVKCLEYAAL